MLPCPGSCVGFHRRAKRIGRADTQWWWCRCLVAQSCLTLWPPGLQPARRLYPWASQARVLEWVGIFSCSPGIETKSPALAGISFTTEPLGKPHIYMHVCVYIEIFPLFWISFPLGAHSALTSFPELYSRSQRFIYSGPKLGATQMSSREW